MKLDLLAQLPRPQREAIESAGYRIIRWVAARGVLQTRVEKGRITGPTGDFLKYWLSLASAQDVDTDLWLSFNYEEDKARLTLSDGGAALARSPLEQALLHLPALRPFWSQELRQQHFAALRALVPQTWLLDPAPVPPGAVIQGLGVISWERAPQLRGEAWQIQDSKERVQENWPLDLAAHDSILTSRLASGVVLRARYERNDKQQVVLRSTEAAP